VGKAVADLVKGVHAGIGSARGDYRDLLPGEDLNFLLHDALNGKVLLLPLPAMVGCAVISQHHFDVSSVHRFILDKKREAFAGFPSLATFPRNA
jgi:hypothetical protein